MAPLPLNGHSTDGMFCILFTLIFGIVSMVCSAKPSIDLQHQEITIPDVFLSISFMAAIMAVPLTYLGTRKYLKQKNSTGLRGFMITAWVFYAHFILSVLVFVLLMLPTRFFIYPLFWGVVGWIFMFVYHEQARRSQSCLPVEGKESYFNQSGLSNASIAIEKVVNEDGTCTCKAIKSSMNPDRLPLNDHSLGGIYCILFTLVFGTVSILCVAIPSNDFVSVNVALSSLSLSLMTAIAAVPLTYEGAERYLKPKNSMVLQCLMIVAWIFYILFIIRGVVAWFFYVLLIYYRFFPYMSLMIGQSVDRARIYCFMPVWFLAFVSWIFMFIYSENARRSQSYLPVACKKNRRKKSERPYNPFSTIETGVYEDNTFSPNKAIKSSIMNSDGTITADETVEMLQMIIV